MAPSAIPIPDELLNHVKNKTNEAPPAYHVSHVETVNHAEDVKDKMNEAPSKYYANHADHVNYVENVHDENSEASPDYCSNRDDHVNQVEPVDHDEHAKDEINNATRHNDVHDTEPVLYASAVIHRSLHCMPLMAVLTKGQDVHLENGQKIWDVTGGAAVACLGHSNERVARAAYDQMMTVSYCHSLCYTTQAAEDLASFLVDSTAGEMSRTVFYSSGSDAVESAAKLARQYYLEKSPPEPQRTLFIARKQSYHGTTLGALAVGGHVGRRATFEPLLIRNTSHVSPCYIYRGMSSGQSHEEYVKDLAAELEAEFIRVGPENVIAFVAEPVVGAALGCVPPVLGYFAAVRKICDKYGALLIFDEVMSGIGRIGPEPTKRFPNPLHAWQDPLIGVAPDIMSLGKGLSGGVQPISAILANDKIIDALQRGSGSFSHGQTYQNFAPACRAALEIQRIIWERDLIANVRQQGKLLGKLLEEAILPLPAVGDIRGKGLFWGIEFVACKTTKEPFDRHLAVSTGIQELGAQEPYNIALYPGTGSVDGHSGDHILIAPMYDTTEKQVREMVQVIKAVITEYFSRHHHL